MMNIGKQIALAGVALMLLIGASGFFALTRIDTVIEIVRQETDAPSDVLARLYVHKNAALSVMMTAFFVATVIVVAVAWRVPNTLRPACRRLVHRTTLLLHETERAPFVDPGHEAVHSLLTLTKELHEDAVLLCNQTGIEVIGEPAHKEVT